MVARYDIGRVRVETRRVADLVPAPYNPRAISDGALAGLGESIGRFGLVQPIIVNARTGHVVGGHQRLKVLEAQGVEATDVVVVDLPEAEEKALNLALNSQRDLGRVDRRTPSACSSEVAASSPTSPTALRLRDLDAATWRKLFPRRARRRSSRTTSPSRPTTRSRKPGDLWVLGDHRLLCGDSGSEEDLDRLLDGAPDPPAQHRPALQREGRAALEQRDPRRALLVLRAREAPPPGARPRASPGEVQAHAREDAREGPAARERLRDRRGVRAAAARVVRQRLARHAARARGLHLGRLRERARTTRRRSKEAGLYFSQTIIWDKQHPVLTRKDFMGAHEWCFYCWKEGAAHQFYGPPNVPDLWAVKKVNAAEDGAPHREARRARRARDPVLLQAGRERARPLRRLGLDAHGLRADSGAARS